MYFEIFKERKLIKRGTHILGGLSWSNELMYEPSLNLSLPITYKEYFSGREEIRIFVNDKCFWGTVIGIEEDKEREVLELDVQHIIYEWHYRQISVNNAIKDENINVIFKGAIIEETGTVSVSGNEFDIYVPDVYTYDLETYIQRSGAVAWEYNGDDVPITRVDDSAIRRKPDEYEIIFYTANDESVTIPVTVKKLRGTKTGSHTDPDTEEQITISAVPFEIAADEVSSLNFETLKKKAFVYAWDDDGNDVPVDYYESDVIPAVGEYEVTFYSGEAKVTIEVKVLEAGAEIKDNSPRYKEIIRDPYIVDELEDVYADMNFAYPGWQIDYSEDAKKFIVDYVYSRQDKLDALTKTMELTPDLFWRVGFTNKRLIEVSAFGEEKRYIFSHKPSGPNNIRIIGEPTIRHDFDNVINMATVYSEKNDSGMTAMTLREVYNDPELQDEGFPVVIVHANVNNERDYRMYTSQFPKLAPNNELEFAVLDLESIALEGGILIEGTYSFNDLSPFEVEKDEDGFLIEVSDEDRIKAAVTGYNAAIRKLKQARRSFTITLETEELPADINVGDKVRFIYDNYLYMLEECSNYEKKILTYDDWFYITEIDYDIDQTGAETNSVTLSKYLKIDRETSNDD